MGPDSRTPEKMNHDVQTRFDQEVLFHHIDEENTLAARQVFELLRNGEPGGQEGDEITNTAGTTQQQRSDGPEVYKIKWRGRAE